MLIPQSRSYIATNPRFALTGASRPLIQRGQMTIVYESLEPFPDEYALQELVEHCIARGYKATFKNPSTDIHKSVLYHLNRLLEGTDRVPPGCIRIAGRPQHVT
jgi:hypothetical protein